MTSYFFLGLDNWACLKTLARVSGPKSSPGWPVIAFQEGVNSGGKTPMKKDFHSMADRILLGTNISCAGQDLDKPRSYNNWIISDERDIKISRRSSNKSVV